MPSQYTLDDVFERRQVYPDPDARARLSKLVGIEDKKLRLAKILGLLVNPAGLKKWADKFHPGAERLVDVVLRRPPLIILAGDVGSGKTELAETIGDAVARLEHIEVTLFPLSLSTRGEGRVGEMTQLITSAFDLAAEHARKQISNSGKSNGATILLIDEADALAQSREAAQMHHEDRAGVNAFIRGIDRIANGRLPAAVLMCTNRLSAIDPAVLRRAAEIFVFDRPTAEQRRHLLEDALEGLGLSQAEFDALVDATGPGSRGYGYTFSDLVQRLLPSVVLDAYPDGKIIGHRVIEIAHEILPTPPFNDQLGEHG